MWRNVAASVGVIVGSMMAWFAACAAWMTLATTLASDIEATESTGVPYGILHLAALSVEAFPWVALLAGLMAASLLSIRRSNRDNSSMARTLAITFSAMFAFLFLFTVCCAVLLLRQD